MEKLDYDKLKLQSRSLRRLANDLISEVEKETPDKVELCDLYEEADELLKQIFSVILGGN